MPDLATHLPDSQDVASPRLLQETNETIRRSRAGGLFYVLLWGLSGWASDLPHQAPGIFCGVGLAFAALAIARYRMFGLEEGVSGAVAMRRLDQAWGLLFATTFLWGVASTWLLLTATDDSARNVTVISTYAFAIASAHSYCMRLVRDLVAVAMLYLPALVIFVATAPHLEIVFIGLLSLLYVALSIRRGNAEYLHRLDLEDELRRQRDLYEQQSRRDGLTGLANRRRFTSVLDKEVAAVRRHHVPPALLLLDVDHFKAINDTHGHAVGDACLQAFASVLEKAFGGQDDLPARTGGEEFAVLIKRCRIVQAKQRAEHFRSLLEQEPLVLDSGIEIPIRVSIGVAVLEGGSKSGAQALYNAADAALYRAKARGRNNVQAAEPV